MLSYTRESTMKIYPLFQQHKNLKLRHLNTKQRNPQAKPKHFTLSFQSPLVCLVFKQQQQKSTPPPNQLEMH